MEFCVLAVFLLLPLAYVILAVFRVQDGAYAVASASREAGRAYVSSDEPGDASGRAYVAASIAMHDHHLALARGNLSITCRATPCLTPGTPVVVRVGADVALPFLPPFLGGARTVHVTGHQVVVVDRYR